jgi:hypothetical protein
LRVSSVAEDVSLDFIAVAPLKIHSGALVSNAAGTLGPNESAEVLRLDLGEYFVISKPENYRVELRSELLGGENGKPGVLAGSFTLAPRF